MYEMEWKPPQLDVSCPPELVLTNNLDVDPDFANNFTRCARWCADGSSFLVQCENRSFQLFNISDVQGTQFSVHHQRTFSQSSAAVNFAWYPGASPNNAPSYCFVASVRDCPVKLLDASDGRLRASYPIIDHRERFIAPHSLAFNLTADKLYCGFEDAVEIFDIQQPGEGDRLPTTPSKKSKDGLKGIISSIAFSSSYDYYAIGSLTPSSQAMDNIALYSESNKAAIMPIGGADVRSGVTQLKFNPMKPHILYAAFRRHNAIYAWDLRSDTSVPVKVFRSSFDSHKTLTNQKIEFDVDYAGRWLSVGDQNGCVSLFDVGESDEFDSDQSSAMNIDQKMTFNAHGDVVGCVAFQPLHSNLLSASGSRHFDKGMEDSDSDSSDGGHSTDQESDSESQNMIKVSRRRPLPYVKDSSLKMWSFDPTRTVHHA
ncbi:WD40-repeat-containing domain protein [Suillus clintonianus]|uniref:WD40-repeat-containing domain protein n=1 Tax=Suillus clintonianus TaxID=1904413 RepID=UPI001B87A173|nr:WD40-repeat-containing domain protein [Suillus clintonianus]KAG2143580.1 WD40-repeat-containing domain protein [Suillus clintonianus]